MLINSSATFRNLHRYRSLLLFAIAIFSLVSEVHSATIQLRSSISQSEKIVVKQGDRFEVEVFVDVGSTETSAIELYLTFDPSELKLLNSAQPFQPQNFYKGNIVLNKTIRNDMIGYAVVSGNDSIATGSGVVAKIEFIAREASTTEVLFNASQEDWDVGHYTSFVRADKNEQRSFGNLIPLSVEIKGSLVEIDRFGLQRFAHENSGSNVPLDTFTTIHGSEGTPELRWQIEAEDLLGRPLPVELNAASQLVVRPLLPKTADGKVKISLRASVKIGNSLSIASAVLWLVNPNIPAIQPLPEVRFRVGSEGIILLDNFVQDLDNINADLRWSVENLPPELQVGNVSFDRFDRSKGAVGNPPRVTFRSLIPIDAERKFQLQVKVVDFNDNHDSEILHVVVEPLPFVRMSLNLRDELQLLRNEEHELDLREYVSIDPPESINNIVWEVVPSDHVEAQLVGLMLRFRPQKDWIGASERVTVTAKFEGKKIDEATIRVNVFDLDEEPEKTFPLSFIRNPLIETEFKIVAIVADAAELATAVRMPNNPEVSPKTVALKKITGSYGIWIGSYTSEIPIGSGQKVVVSVVGKNTRNQHLPSATKVFNF